MRINEIWNSGNLGIEDMNTYLSNIFPDSTLKYKSEKFNELEVSGTARNILTCIYGEKSYTNFINNIASKTEILDGKHGKFKGERFTPPIKTNIKQRHFERLYYTLINNAIKKFSKTLPDGWEVGVHFTNDEPENIQDIIVTIGLHRDINDKVVNSDNVYLHITLAENIGDIFKNGLQTKSKYRVAIGSYRDKIFLLNKNTDMSKIKDLAGMLQYRKITGDSKWKDTHNINKKDIVVFQVNVSENVKKYKDPRSDGIYIESAVLPENIQILYKGPIENINF